MLAIAFGRAGHVVHCMVSLSDGGLLQRRPCATDPRHPCIPGRDKLNARCWAGKRAAVYSPHLTEQVSILNTHTAIVAAICPHSCLGTDWYETEVRETWEGADLRKSNLSISLHFGKHDKTQMSALNPLSLRVLLSPYISELRSIFLSLLGTSSLEIMAFVASMFVI